MKQTTNKRSNPQSWPMKALTAAVAVGIMGTLVPANSATESTDRKPIGDLEIYKAAKPGTASIFMMLDTSGSMDRRSIRSDYGTSYSAGCSENFVSSATINAKIYNRKYKLTPSGEQFRDDDGKLVIIPDYNSEKKTITFTPKGCTTNNGVTRYSRLTRLQIALIELLADRVYSGSTLKDTGSLPDDYAIGLGNYSYAGNGRSGVVLVPTQKLTPDHRVTLIDEIDDLEATGGTPTAQALAESGAYMLGTSTIPKGSNSYSYSGYSNSVSTSKENGKYISPLNDDECSGNGIYLLTDGEPSGSITSASKTLMNASLSDSNPALSVNTCTSVSGDSTDKSWGCMATYTSLLRNTASNSKELPIKTATVGFGKSFAGLSGKRTITVNGKTKEVVDCDSGNVNSDTRNLCKLGERRGDGETKSFGDGGFYYTEESSDIAESIVDFSTSLVQIINTAPSGTITIPDDPYRASYQLPYAYLPMLDPDIISSASIWKGNLKKYKLNKGTLFGNNDNILYKDISGKLNETTQDVWQTADFEIDNSIANNNIAAGGVYAQLLTPSSGLSSVRTIYVEDYASVGNKKPVLRKVGVNAIGKPVGFDALVDTVAYSELNKRRLLSFLGFESVLTNDGQPTDAKLVKNLTLVAPTEESKLLGGVVHSKPAALSYESALDTNGRIIDPRDDYVLFGSMDGALHLVDSDDGKEELAVIPRQMMINQPEALVSGSKKAKIGEPYFGVDAPWLVTTDYTYDITNKKVTVDTTATNKGIFAYGGLRMGGEAIYGIDITKKTDPKALFTITPTGLNNTTSTDFQRLGQVWSKPVEGRIRMTKDAKPLDVIVFGGGYDMLYEDDTYLPNTAAPAKGNAIYMVNAQTGALIWSASATGSTTNISSMINSITGGITVLDRDNDGLIDHLYAADLGGQVFRADFVNARNAEFGFTAVNSFASKGITRILNAAPTAAAYKQYAYRFYESPVVSFYRNEGISGQVVADNGKLFALVNVVSGNRSAPLSKLRNDNNYANRVYGIIDSDVTNSQFYESTFNKSIKDLTESSLVNLALTLGAAPNKVLKTETQESMIKGTKKGWYYPLTRFDGYDKVRYNKGIGESVAINNLLYTTIYNPDKVYGNVSSCSARISGGSERQIYCLPYGICMDDTSISGTGGYTPAGQGIQELAIGAYDDKNTDIRVLIGTTTISDRIEAANRTKYGKDAKKDDSNMKDLYSGDGVAASQDGGDGSAIEYLFNERYTMQPKAWYERKQ